MAKFIEINEDLSGASDELRYVNIEHIVISGLDLGSMGWLSLLMRP